MTSPKTSLLSCRWLFSHCVLIRPFLCACISLVWLSLHKDTSPRAPPLWSHLTLTTSWKILSPNTVNWGLELWHMTLMHLFVFKYLWLAVQVTPSLFYTGNQLLLRLCCFLDSSFCLLSLLLCSMKWPCDALTLSTLFRHSYCKQSLFEPFSPDDYREISSYKRLISSQKPFLIWYKFHWIWQLSVLVCGFVSFIADGVFSSGFHSIVFSWFQAEWGKMSLFGHYLYLHIN